MGKMISIHKQIPCIFVVLLQTTFLFGQTREGFLKIVADYANCEWTCSKNNILDVEAPPDVDDRKTKREKAWPFKIGDIIYGVPYVYGSSHSITEFKDKICSLTGNYIAGNDGTKLPPGYGYKGFTGVDCSGLVSNALGKFERLTTNTISKYAVGIKNLNDFRPGDLFNKDGDHVLIFDGGDIKSRISAFHAVSWAFGSNEYVRRTIHEDNIAVTSTWEKI